ncbi:MAG: NAD(P)-dependent methylenetetrahydromethanopterin dehydrogenase [Planctomycetota bacterium]
MSKPKILFQLDSDAVSSSFDAVVAIDAGVEHLLQYSEIRPDTVVPLVHGGMFTRGPADLKNTAIFVGGSDVQLGVEIGDKIRSAFFGPIRVSTMLDGNGANTTASAAVLCGARHQELSEMDALVLGATGPVGTRVSELILAGGGRVRLASRTQAKADQLASHIADGIANGIANGDSESPSDAVSRMSTLSSADVEQLGEHVNQCSVVFGCGAAGIELVDAAMLDAAGNLQVAIDLNAVPPAGLGGIEATDKAIERGSRVDYGALGVGGLKMKIHKACIQRLFESNDQFLDTQEIFDIGQEIEASR